MESSPQVNLYIETTVHGPRQQGGRWMYLLEFVTRRGDENGWLEEWQERGWKTVKGQDIKHKDLWQKIAPKMAPHLVSMRAGGHSYQLWMQEKLKKMVETPQETR